MAAARSRGPWHVPPTRVSRMNESGAGAGGPLVLPDVLEILGGLEADGPARWDPDLLARAGIATDAPFARLDLEYPEPA